MTQRGSQTAHDRMVGAVKNYLVRNEFSDIRADLAGCASPTKIIWADSLEGHVPDATGVKDGQLHVFEVETKDTIVHPHSAKQWRLFAAYVRQHSGSFCLVVPMGSAYAARQELARLNITAAVWEA